MFLTLTGLLSIFKAAAACLTLFPLLITAQDNISRKPLLDIKLPKRAFDGLVITEITFPPGQTAPAHTHPCPVTGQILSGKCYFQAEGEQPVILNAGEAFYEPAGKLILHFDNASSDDRMTFLACYIKEGSEPLIHIVKQDEGN